MRRTEREGAERIRDLKAVHIPKCFSEKVETARH